jgi:hypothetical protein
LKKEWREGDDHRVRRNEEEKNEKGSPGERGNRYLRN